MTYKQPNATTNRLFLYSAESEKFFDKIKCS